MATINALKTVNENKTVLFTWETMEDSDVGAAVRAGSFADKTVQVVGNFSGSAIVTMEGSMDGVTWSGLEDTLGAAMTFAAAGMEVMLENPIFIRPNLGATGDGSTDIDVRISASGVK